MNNKKKNNKISTYIVNKSEQNNNDNKKQISTQNNFNGYLNDFSSFPGDGWLKKQGKPTENDDGTYNCTFNYTSSSWLEDGFGNVGTTGAARVNIYSTSQDEWLISPVFNLPHDAFSVSCDAASTAWAQTTSGQWSDDDWVALFMTSNGSDSDSTWIELYRWDLESNNIPASDGTPTGDILISGYSDINYGNVQFGFYAESTVYGNSDNDFFIDNFKIKLAPDATCDEDAGPATGTVDPHNSLAILTPDLLGPNNGTASIQANGSWSYTPNPNFNGMDTFTITIDGSTVSKVLKIYVVPVDDIPTITGDISGFYRGQPVTGQLSVIDNFDGFTNADRFSITSNGTKGSASIQLNSQDLSLCSWTYTPNTNFMDTDTFIITITDDDGHIENQTINIIGALSGDNTGVIDEDNGQVTGKLTINSAYTTEYSINNSDPFSVTQNAANGTANIDNQGNWSYTPDEHFNGTDTFIVTLTDDDNNTQTKTITITVNPVNDIPTITGDISGIYIGNSQPVTGQLIVDDVEGFTNSNRFSIYNSSDNMVTLDFNQYAITEGGTLGTYSEFGVANIYSGDWIFEDISTTDTEGIIAWGTQIEVQSKSNDNWTKVRLRRIDNQTFNFKGFKFRAEDSGIYKLVNPSGHTYTVFDSSSSLSWNSFDNITELNNNFSNVAYVDFDAIKTGSSNFTKWHLDDIELELAIIESVTGTATIDNDGNWTYTPYETFDETDTFTVIITDDLGSETLQDITITKMTSVKPYIISGNRADSIMEYSGANQMIYKAFADDPDSPISDLTFYIDAPIDSETGEITLSIDSKNGEVTLIPNPVYDKDNSEYIFNVYAKDKDGNTSYAKTVTLNILPASITLKQPNTEDGMPQDDIIINVKKKGWKLIGTTTESVLLHNNLIVSNSIYMLKDGYETIAYSEADEGYPLQPNKGYWIRFDW